MSGLICPYCEDKIKAGEHLWAVYIVISDDSSIIQDPSSPPGATVKIQQTLAHCKCAVAVASHSGIPFVITDGDSIKTRWSGSDVT